MSDDGTRQTPSAALLRKLIDRSLTDLKLAADAARAEGRNDVAALVEGSKGIVRRAASRLLGKGRAGARD